jgi:6-phosphogluconolactonase
MHRRPNGHEFMGSCTKKQFVERIKARDDQLAQKATERFTTLANDAISKRGSFHVAVPGGSVAQLFFPSFASSAVNWKSVHVYWVDERQVPHQHPESNFRVANEFWLSKVPAVAHPFDDCDEYLRILPPVLDLAVLGVGPDGHIASLFPDRPELHRTERAFDVDDAPKPPPKRRTLSLGEICAANDVWVVMTGTAKAPILKQALQADSKLPVAQVFQRAQPLTLWVNPAAAT